MTKGDDKQFDHQAVHNIPCAVFQTGNLLHYKSILQENIKPFFKYNITSEKFCYHDQWIKQMSTETFVNKDN